MKKLALLFSIVVLASGICLAQTTSFTYQGKLGDAGAPANGSYDFQFKLFDQSTGGTQQGSTLTLSSPGVTVANGGFTVQLEFGANFPGGASGDRYLETSVRVHSADPNTPVYSTLTPRQQIRSTPYAIRSLSAATADNVSGIVSVANGGTGGSTQNFVDLNSHQSIGGNKTFTGVLSGDGSGLTNIRATFLWQIVANINSLTAVSNTGYLITNPTRQVRITLPVEPLNVGDVVRVSSGGEGGWKILQNAGQSIFLGNLSFVGTNWIAHEGVRLWSAVASSADGSKLVAVSNQAYTSDDSGATWLPHGVIGLWVSVASSADGTKLVGVTAITSVSSGGHVYTSTDSGVNWTESPESRKDWQSVASSADGTKLVAVVGHNTAGKIYTSADSGATWSAHESDRFWHSVASSADGSKLVAAVLNGQIYTSTDFGATWFVQDFSRFWESVASSADGSNLVAVTRSDSHLSIPGAIFTSSDSGLNWIKHSIAGEWQSVASSADGSKLLAVASGGQTGGGQIYISADSGATWTPHEANRAWFGAASSDDGSKLVVVVTGGQIYTSSGTSAATTTAGAAGDLVGGEKAAIELQYVGNGTWILLSHEGSITGH